MKRTLRIIGNIFGAPSEAFTEIKKQPSWFTVFVVIAIVSIGTAWAILPFSEQMARAKMLESGMDATQMEQGQAMAELLSSVGLFLIAVSITHQVADFCWAFLSRCPITGEHRGVGI